MCSAHHRDNDLNWSLTLCGPNDSIEQGHQDYHSYVRTPIPGKASFLLCFGFLEMGPSLKSYLLKASSLAQRMQRRHLSR